MVGVGVSVTVIEEGSSPSQMVWELLKLCEPVKVFTLMVNVAVDVQPDPSAFSATVTEKVSPFENPLKVIEEVPENTPIGFPLYLNW